MTTILLIAFVALAVYCRVWLWRVAKHDRVLFPFCQLRRDIMRFLREHMPDAPNALSREEYDSVLRLEDVVSIVIRNYKEHKTAMFNIRKIIKFSREYQDALNRAKPIDMTDNDEIKKFHHQFRGLLARAFFAYTPLIRVEIFLYLVGGAYQYGKARAQQEAKEVASAAHAAREDKRCYGELADTVMAAA